jgi:hypothetical protein
LLSQAAVPPLFVVEWAPAVENSNGFFDVLKFNGLQQLLVPNAMD